MRHLVFVTLFGWLSGMQGAYATLGICHSVRLTVWYAGCLWDTWYMPLCVDDCTECRVPMRHLVYATLCGWLSGMQGAYETLGICHSVWMTVWYAGCLCDTWYMPLCVDDCLVCRVPMRHLEFVTLCRRLSGMHSHRYSCSSWWWAHSRTKHVQKRNKHTKKNLCTKLALFTRHWDRTRTTNYTSLA